MQGRTRGASALRDALALLRAQPRAAPRGQTFVNERAVPGTGLVLPRARGTRHVQAQHMQPAKTCAGTLGVPLHTCCPVALEGRGKALRHTMILFFRFEALERLPVTLNLWGLSRLLLRLIS